MIPTVLCIDVEPDDLSPKPAEPWRGFETMVAWTATLRERLATRTGEPVSFIWALRMDPQVTALHGSPGWVAERYGAELDALRGAGDALALHTHAWRLDAGGGWVADWGDGAWAEQCLATGLEAYETAFGQPCRIHRFGDRYVTAALLDVLERGGVEVDLTVEPGARRVRAMYPGWRSTVRTVDYARAPRRPYLRAPGDPLRPADRGGRGPWLVPLTALDHAALTPSWRRLARRVRYPLRARHRPAILWGPARLDGYWEVVERELAAAVDPYLAFAVRSDVLLREPSRGRFQARMETLLSSPLADRLRFVDPLALLREMSAPAMSPPP